MAAMCLLLVLVLLALAAPTSLSRLPNTISARASADLLSAGRMHATGVHRRSCAEHDLTTCGAVGALHDTQKILVALGAGVLRASSGLRLRGGGKKAKARAKANRLSVSTFATSFTAPGSGDGAGAHLLSPNSTPLSSAEPVWKEVKRKGRKEVAGRKVGGQRVVIDGSNIVKEGGGKVHPRHDP